MKTQANQWMCYSPSLFLPVLIVFHLALDIVVAVYSSFLGELMTLFAVAIAFSQVSLIAILASALPLKPVFRFAIISVGAFVGWGVLSRVLLWGVGENTGAAWAIAMAFQSVVVWLLISVYCRFKTQRQAGAFQKSISGKGSITTATVETSMSGKFGPGTLMLWTAATSLVFGFVKYGQDHWQWTLRFEWEVLIARLLIGLVNGLLAVQWFWSICINDGRSRVFKIGITVLMTGALALMQATIVEGLTGTTDYSVSASFGLLAAQSLLIALSLLVANVLRRTSDRKPG